MIYLLDTDTLVYLMRGMKIEAAFNERQRERQAVGNRISVAAQQAKQAGHKIGLSAITVAELEFGAQNSRDYNREMAVVGG